MRSVKELLEVMLKHQNAFEKGLCGWILHLRFYKIISFDEWKSLSIYIKENKPSKFSSLDCFSEYMYNTYFYWSSGKIAPRIKWIKKHINKLNRKP